MLSYPLQLDPSRRCFTSLINTRMKRHQQHSSNISNGEIPTTHTAENNEDAVEEEEMFYSLASNDTETSLNNEIDSEYHRNNQQDGQDWLFIGITCSFLILSFIVAMSVSDLGIMLGIVGATGSTIVSYILPGKCKDPPVGIKSQKDAIIFFVFVSLIIILQRYNSSMCRCCLH